MPTNQVTDAETRVEQYIAGAGYEFPTTGDLRALLALLATLREERDALLADKARYNYLADLAFRSPQARLIVADGEWSVDNGNNRLGTGDTCNAALDAARAPQGRTE